MSCSFGIKSSLRYCGRNGTEARLSLQAVDACFKLLYIFDIEYPKPAAAIWLSLQHTILYIMFNQHTVTYLDTL